MSEVELNIDEIISCYENSNDEWDQKAFLVMSSLRQQLEAAEAQVKELTEWKNNMLPKIQAAHFRGQL